MATSPVLYVYYPPLNDDSYPGVPGRHITEADWASFTIAQRRTIENATTQEGWYRRKVWVHRDLVDETEEERAQREAEEAAARAEYDRKNSLVRYGQIEAMIDQLEVLPPAEEFAALRQDVDAVADVPPRVEAVEQALTHKADTSAVQAVETQVARVDPGEYAGAVGESLAQGPDGPAWRRDAVSADWFSNINDAITAARNTGDGGIVILAKDTTYTTNGQPLLVSSGLKVMGESARSSRISVDADAGVRVAAFNTRTEYVTLRDFTLNGTGTTPIGLDLRGFYKSHIENFFINGCEVGIWVGGDLTQYHSCWSNYVVNGKIDTTDAGTGVRFSGTTNGGGSGAATANNNFFSHVDVNIGPDVASIGYDLQVGDTNLIQHTDCGYSNGAGIPFRFGDKSFRNTVAFSRTEACERSVVMDGGSYNRVTSNSLVSVSTTYYPVEVGGNAQWALFENNAYAGAAKKPYVFESGPVFNLQVHDLGVDGDWYTEPVKFVRGTGALALTTRRKGEANDRFQLFETGALTWLNPTTGAINTRLRNISTSGPYMAWDDGTYFQIPIHTSLSAANAAKRGSIIRLVGAAGVADGVYICLKSAGDTYSWVKIADGGA